MALTQMSVRQLGHTAAGFLSARVSDHMINVLFVTVSKYISEVFIINAHTDVLTEDRVGAETRMSEGNSTDRRSSTLMYIYQSSFQVVAHSCNASSLY